MRRVIIFFVFSVVAINLGGDITPEWKLLAPGLEIKIFKAKHAAPQGDSKVTVLRIDPKAWDLEFAGTGQPGEKEERSARDWSARKAFTAAINAGMFRQEGGVHAGYLGFGDRVYSKKITSYQSVAAFGPHGGDQTRFR